MRPGEEKIVVLDPGHGGKDSGAVGPTGLKESEVVLEVARYCAKFLADAGVKVYLTRTGDDFLSLEKRARLANHQRADLFVSVHCNSAKNPAQGIETFIARRTKVSYPLAEEIQESLTAAFPDTPDRGVKRRNFTVLTKTAMAAALAELEFIHTMQGEKILRLPGKQKKYGFALAHGILSFLGLVDLLEPDDPEEPVACVAWETEVAFKAKTPADLVEVGERLGRLEDRVFGGKESV